MGTVINFNPSDIKDGYKYMLLESRDWRLGDNTHPHPHSQQHFTPLSCLPLL